eukprot:m.21771 g.21771  ORF g.21771 m.21771 type:complete len:555 (+) comp8334_c0_seq1:179-1843(+)
MVVNQQGWQVITSLGVFIILALPAIHQLSKGTLDVASSTDATHNPTSMPISMVSSAVPTASTVPTVRAAVSSKQVAPESLQGAKDVSVIPTRPPRQWKGEVLVPVQTARGEKRIRPPVRQCQAHGGVRHADESSRPRYLGCVGGSLTGDRTQQRSTTGPSGCVKQCEQHHLTAMSGNGACACLVAIPNTLTRLPEKECKETAVYGHASFPFPLNHKVAPTLQEIDVFMFVSERLASLWTTCRMTNHSSQYNYNVFDMRFQTTPEEFVELIAPARPNPKIIVYNSCCTPPYALEHWPASSILVVSGDESARWGFSHKNGKNWWGPHGDQGPLPSDSSGNMIMPPHSTPFFKQYFSQKHVEVYGDAVRFLPLGSRTEFPDPEAGATPATMRQFIFSFMGAPTNYIRKYLFEVFREDTAVPKDQIYMHLADHWSTDPNDASTGYVNSTTYAAIMRESAFTLCPKGNSVEQYRIYEALESASIPVICHEGKYARDRLPPEIIESPILFVDDWKDAPKAIMELWNNPARLLKRQIELAEWYDKYMRGRVKDLEASLEVK